MAQAHYSRARRLRQKQTPAEEALWYQLRARRLGGLKFRRQHLVGKYVVDFASCAAKLAIEVDGETHSTAEQADFDRRRTAYLGELGWDVIRFWNCDVFNEIEGVCGTILHEVNLRLQRKQASPPIAGAMGPSSPRGGEAKGLQK